MIYNFTAHNQLFVPQYKVECLEYLGCITLTASTKNYHACLLGFTKVTLAKESWLVEAKIVLYAVNAKSFPAPIFCNQNY